MNLGNLIFWSASIITALAGVHNIDSIQRSILKAQAMFVYESRTETWGSYRNSDDSDKLFGKNSKSSHRIHKDRAKGL